MHLKSKYGKPKSNEEINESLRQVVFALSNFTKMKEQIKIFRGLNQIFLGKEAKTTEGIWDFYKLIRKNESALKHKCNDDNLLQKTFAYRCVQRYIYRWRIVKLHRIIQR